jgi:catechol 2,3-dioxygenase-like lactoylglutathione lyase family enzyme
MRPRLIPELICTDLEQSLRFYRDVLGFRILYSRPEDQFVFLDRNGAELMLEQGQAQDRLWPRAPLTYPFGRGVNFQVQVDDIDEVLAAVRVAGIGVFLPLEEKWYRRDQSEIGVREFAVQDPDGYLIRLSQAIGTRQQPQ